MRANLKLFCTAMLLAGTVFTSAQEKAISGQVTDSNGFPVADAYVYVEGTENGVYTDADGNYSISAESGDVLVVEFIGFDTRQIPVGISSTYDVNLEQGGIELQDVVTVGYRQVTRGEESGSTVVINGDDLGQTPATSFEEAMKGMATGVQISNASGQPGSYSKVRIRGIGSINGNNEPLYIIDGVFMDGQSPSTLGGPDGSLVSPLSSINPNDIDEVVVLKDAASTSIYGSRGANGVIIINTKRGKNKKGVVSYSSSWGVSNLMDMEYRPLNAYEYTEIRREALIGQGLDPAEALLAVPDPEFVTNWEDYAMVDDAITMKHDISFRGGSEAANYFVSLGYMDQDGIILNSGFERMSAKVNADFKVSDKFNIGLSTNISRENQKTPSTDAAYYSNPFVAYYFAYPNVSPYLPDGTPSGNIGVGNTSFLRVAEYNKESLQKNRFIGSLSTSYEIVDNLTYTLRGNVDYLDNKAMEYYDSRTGGNSAADGVGLLTKAHGYYQTWSLNNVLQYDLKFDNNNLSFILGQEALSFENEDISAQGTGFVSPDVVTLSTAADPYATSQYWGDYSLLSYFGNATYNYNGRYFLNATYRRDASSRFSEDNRWGSFWSVGASWNLHDEAFARDAEWVSEFSPRISYGTQGNLPSGYYSHLGLYNYTDVYDGANGASEEQIANPNLKWEEQTLFEVGVDFEIFDRLSGSYSYFDRETNDLIINRPLSYGTGFSSQDQNYGSMVNKGHELALNLLVVDTEDFSWNIGGNITFLENEVYDIEQPYEPYSWVRRENGGSMYDFYMPDWAGVDPATGVGLWYNDAGDLTSNWSEARRVFHGSALPDYYGGVNTSFKYKGFDVSALGSFNYGNKIYDNMGRYVLNDGNRATNFSYRILDRWQNPGDLTDIPRLGIAENNDVDQISSRYLRDGSYFRIQNIKVGYTLPTDLISQAGISSMRIYVQGQNIYTFTNFDYDPEVGDVGSNGSHFFSFPNATTYTVGLQVSL